MDQQRASREPGAKHTGALGTRSGKTCSAGMVVMEWVRPQGGEKQSDAEHVVLWLVLLGT